MISPWRAASPASPWPIGMAEPGSGKGLAAKDPAAWQDFSARYLDVADEAAYQVAVKERA